MNKPVVLCILDGCGIREESDGNAFKNATKPTLDMLFNKYPHSILQASGPSVGLPEGQMGTSEVGHMNLGSGRIALQPLQAITQSIESKELNKNEKILDVLNHVRENNSNLHIMGLLSDGGVHSHINHLLALLDICKENNIENVYIDVMLDGRDTYEKSAIKYLDILQKKLQPNEILLICSDGLTNMLADPEIEEVVNRNTIDPAKELIERANLAGGYDNITAIVIHT